MTEFFFEYGLFAAKLATFVIAILVIVVVTVAATRRVKKSMKGHIETTRVNDEIDAMRDAIDAGISDPEAFKLHIKQKRKAEKLEHKARRKALKQAARRGADEVAAEDVKSRVFILDFDGDLRASAVSRLRREITAVLSLARASDELVLRLESRGGMVHSYGLASSQLQRIKEHGIGLTVCVDKVAASGGYMMACVANKILAAPFAIIGSIGVVAQIPNFNRLLKKNDIDFEMITAGEYKRTLTILGENTDKGREKFTEEIEDIHLLFKEFVAQHRPALDIGRVATGESWFGQRALDLALVDELMTSDEYITRACAQADVFEVRYVERKPLPERLGIALQESVDGLLMRWWERGTGSRFFS
ncbi:MAG: protease SohB [Gammaproteobacteria bacterium]|nr:protease SohB [Gammaproteobacteria bacterium]MDH3447539.1 protease SohB [Gammaproteobacteria bacterium]